MHKPDAELLGVSRETFQAIDRFADLVLRWTPRINLVSRGSEGDLWSRHIADSIQIAKILLPKGHWVDLGAGGGFPGIIVAILAKEQGPGAKITLIESDNRKAVFLKTVARELQLPVQVMTERIEKAAPCEADILSARALADLDTLLGYADRHLRKYGTALFAKGQTWRTEAAEARKKWNFDLEVHPSKTDNKAAVLQISNIVRV